MQTRLESFIESCLNIGSGFFLAVLTWICVIEPLFDIDKRFHETLEITAIFTVVSVLRSYVWRRIGNWHLQRKLRRAMSEPPQWDFR